MSDYNRGVIVPVFKRYSWEHPPLFQYTSQLCCLVFKIGQRQSREHSYKLRLLFEHLHYSSFCSDQTSEISKAVLSSNVNQHCIYWTGCTQVVKDASKDVCVMYIYVIIKYIDQRTLWYSFTPGIPYSMPILTSPLNIEWDLICVWPCIIIVGR
jgi:hypothetical protein